MAKEPQPQSPSTALALPGKPLRMDLPQEWLEETGGPMLLTSLDLTDERCKSALVEAMDGECEESGQWVNREMHVQHVVLHPVEYMEQETGEEIKFIRCVLILSDGKRVQFGSGGIVKSLRMLSIIAGDPPWSPPLKVMLERIPTSGGRSRYRLRRIG